MSLARNGAFSAISLVTRVVSAAAALVIQARFLGPETFGKFAFAVAIAAMLSLITDFGMSLRALRELASGSHHPRDYVRSDLRLRALLLAPFVAIALMISLLGRPPVEQLAYISVFTGFAAVSAGDYGLSLLRSMGRYSIEAKLVATSFTLQFLITVGFTLVWPTLLGAGLGLLASRVVYLALVIVVVSRTLPPNEGERISDHPFDTLKRSIPYAQDVLISNSMAQIDVLIAGAVLRPLPLGLYAIANRGFQVVSQGMGAASTVFIPALSAAQADGPRRRRIANILFAISAAGASTALLVIVCFGSLLQRAVLGAHYDALKPYWLWIGLGVFTRVLAASTAMPLTAQGLQHIRVRAQIIGVACLAVGSIMAFLVGLNGLFGALVATYGVITAVQLLALSRSATPPPRWFHAVLAIAVVVATLAHFALN